MQRKNTVYAKNTKVSSFKSRREIERLVHKYAGTEATITIAQSPEIAVVQFAVNGRTVRFNLNLPTVADMPAARGRSKRTPILKQHEKEVNRLWRCLYLIIKAKFAAAETGLETFEQAFLANALIDGGVTVWTAIAEGADGITKRFLLPTKDAKCLKSL